MIVRIEVAATILMLCAGVGLSAPKGPSSGSLERAPLFRGEPVTPDEVMPFQDGGEGVSYTLLRFGKKDAPATRVRIRDMHLPSGARLFAYGISNGAAVNVQGPFEGSGPVPVEFWTAPVAGDEIVLEFQVTGEIPADLPFRVVEIAEAPLSEIVEQKRPGDVKEIRTASFRGVNVTVELEDGLAFFEGDIVLGRAADLDEPADFKSGKRQALAITGSNYRWPNGAIPYVIDASMPNISRVTDAISHWNSSMTGTITLVPRTNQNNYVYFYRDPNASRCAAAVGMSGYGMQYVYLGDYCSTGNVIHEIGHAVGLWHEQSREDRNSYVRILTENITSTALYNFNQNITNGDDVGVYDYGSIMHYGAYAFSANGLPTIETIPAGIYIGQRSGLSQRDIEGVRAMYGGIAPPPPPPPSTMIFTVQTSPSGMPVMVDGANYTSPVSFTWNTGSVHTVSALNPPATSTTKMAFGYWSNGGAQSQSVTASAGAPSLTAYYSRYFKVTATPNPQAYGSATVAPVSADTFYAENSNVTLKATPASGFCFSGWSGLLPGTSSSISLSVTGSYATVANFQAGGFTLTQTRTYLTSPSATTITVGVTANSGCAWTAQGRSNWLTVSPSTGSGSGVVTISVAQNTTGKNRLGTVIIAGQVYYVSQPRK